MLNVRLLLIFKRKLQLITNLTECKAAAFRALWIKSGLDSNIQGIQMNAQNSRNF